ncbi:TIR domain-containing protein [Actinomadura sp. NPDC000600]|uniref:TIR domain-containing protein n=1 Tax=Actinomadura sp. NPDC000600 TaxID=3154262 RepID=UPI0033922C40
MNGIYLACSKRRRVLHIFITFHTKWGTRMSTSLADATSGGAIGFWSYTHRDDEADNGRIRRIAERIRDEYELLTGQELKVFVDREGIAWGDQWRAQINDALRETTFFVAIVTPRYLRSEECRREILQFAAEAKSLGLQELLLPVLYAPVAGLDKAEESGDEVLSLIARTQWEDWSNLRLLDEQSTEYRMAINKLATRLAEVSDRLLNEPPAVIAPDQAEEDEVDEPGLIDLMAQAEQVLPKWANSIEEFSQCLAELSDVTIPFGQRIEESDRAGKGMAGRLTLIRSFANQVDPLAVRMREAGSQYSSYLVSVDAAILTWLREVYENPAYRTDDDVLELFEGIKILARDSGEAASEMRTFSKMIADAGRTSRDFRRVARKIGMAVQSVIDGQAIVDEWTRRIEEIEKLSN